MDIEPKYMELIHPDASFLLRPKTNLNDMIVEIEPGSEKGEIEDGAHFTLAQTEPNTNLDAFLATLDADTRQYIQLLVAGGAQGIGGRGKQLSNALRRFQPFVHYTAKLNKAVADRHVALSHVIHDFGLLTTELGRHDADDQALRHLLQGCARQLRQPAGVDPGCLQGIPLGAAGRQRRARELQPLLAGRLPGPDQADPAGAGADARLPGDRAPVQRNHRSDPRPDPTLHPRNPPGPHPRHEAAKPFEKTVRNFGNSLGGFNGFLNELAYKPKGSRESILFYLPWLNHNFNPPSTSGRRRPDVAGNGPDHLQRAQTRLSARRQGYR